MTRLLISVRSVDEAQLALGAGVDLIDIKEPNHGSLGAAPAETIQRIAQLVAGRVPVSAALGELVDYRPILQRELTGIAYVKLGLAGCENRLDWRERWKSATSAMPEWLTHVAVSYADYQSSRSPEPESVIDVAATLGCGAVLVDTFEKSAGDLFEHLGPKQVAILADRVRAAGMFFVLAGGLQGSNLVRAIDLHPDFVALRGAVCRGGRDGLLDAERLQSVVAQLGEHGYRSRHPDLERM